MKTSRLKIQRYVCMSSYLEPIWEWISLKDSLVFTIKRVPKY